jgi:Ankyrin repeats (3 copies)
VANTFAEGLSGADPTASDNNGWTTLHIASYLGYVDVARMLIERGADLIDGWTPLHLASYWGQVDVARKLIEHGADLTAKNNDWETPLHLTLRGGQMNRQHTYEARCGCDSPEHGQGDCIASRVVLGTITSGVSRFGWTVNNQGRSPTERERGSKEWKTENEVNYWYLVIPTGTILPGQVLYNTSHNSIPQ